MIKIYFLLFLIGSTACKSVDTIAEPQSEITPETPVIAVVNEIDIHQNQFEEYLEGVQGELYQDPRVEPPRRELFREFITVILLLDQARREEFVIDENTVEVLLEEWSSHPEDGEEPLPHHLRDYLTAQHFLHRKIQDHCQVNLGEMQRYYNAHHDNFIVDDQVHVLEIFVESRGEIETLANLAEDAEVRDFMELARQHSRGVTASSGGDLGFFSRGELPEKFEEVVFALKAGEISKPVESIHGFHLFMVEEWLPRHPRKFYEVRDLIFQEIIASKERAAQRDYLAKLMNNADIEIFDESLDFRDKERKTDDQLAE